jgi:hypothetical protein
MKSTNVINDEKGVALMMVLVISTIALAVMSALIYMITIGTQMSGSQKRYETALEAGDGGKEIVFLWIADREVPPDLTGIAIDNTISNDCMEDKLLDETRDWDSACDASLSIDIEEDTTYDMKFDLGTFRVYSKIVNTVEGNSSSGGSSLTKSGVVSSNTGEVSVKHVPYLYTIEVEARSATNPNSLAERAKLSILYQY